MNGAREESRMTQTAARIESILRAKFDPVHFAIVDETARHAGHLGAASGGGHYHVVIVSDAFEGRSRLEQHRMVHRALGEMMGRQIHALGLRTIPTSEWDRETGPIKP
ncbi:MAG: BolA family transcriptional regulator [Acidobacteriota bacterium]|nr:MAG: BolA family transcriptional regulator [Acidobacteriota bacterium]